MHCWAQGVHYAAMPLDDIRYALETVGQYCAHQRYDFSGFPMHEVAAHPEAPAVLALFRELAARESENIFEPLATTGVPIALRDDWRDALAGMGAAGVRTFWVAFHGYEETHDRLVNRRGAFRETCLAVERIKSAGFRCGCNVFVTKENLPQFPVLMQTLKDAGIDEQSWEPADFFPTARGRHYEALRPELEDMLPYAGEIKAVTGFWKAKWEDLPAYTEAAHVARALQDEWPASWQDDSIKLVCRPNLDIYSGKAGVYGMRHGNLRTDDIADLMAMAVAQGSCSSDLLCFGTDAPPSVAELARTVGDPSGKAVHFGAHSVRNRWLDLAARRDRLPS